MALINEDDINLIRSKANIVDVISSYIDLVPKGKNYFGVCPFHDDHSPSLSVSNDLQMYKCFTCGNAGNVFTFIQNFENVSFIEAVKIVSEKIGYNINIDTKSDNPNKKYLDIMELSKKLYINNLNSKDGKLAKEYLLNERKLSENIIDEFQIGLSLNDNSLSKLLKNKGYADDDIIKISLANKTDYGLSDLFKSRITFPINNDKGETIAYSARIYQNEDTNKYINSKESIIFKKSKTLFNFDKAKKEAIKLKNIILVEGQMDAIRVYSSGIKNVCATMGTALTTDHIALLKKINSKVILIMDNDKAGENSTITNGEELIKNNIDVGVVRLSGEKDPDTYILNNGIDKFKDLVKNNISFFEYKLLYLKKNKNLDKSDELANYINSVINELNNSDDEIFKEVTINDLSKKYNIDKKILLNKLKPVTKDNKPIKIIRSIPKLNKYKKASESILYLMMNDSKYIRKYKLDLNYFPDKLYKDIATDIIAFKEINGEFILADFMTYIENFEYKKEIYRILTDYENTLADEFDNYVKIVHKWIDEKRISKLKEKLVNETDINKKQEINDLIIKIKKGSGE